MHKRAGGLSETVNLKTSELGSLQHILGSDQLRHPLYHNAARITALSLCNLLRAIKSLIWASLNTLKGVYRELYRGVLQILKGIVRV